MDNNIIKAGGILLYRKTENNIHLLLIKSRGKYEDIGGRVDKHDKTIYDTVVREAIEETNGVLNNISIFDRIKDSEYIYNAKSKYALFIIEATDTECKLESEIFGDKEIHDNIMRNILWVPVDNFIKCIKLNEVNYRLINKDILRAIHKLKDKKN
jgi:8-oxo-dGTP pyrophosphatase MutT (NUDIX family)